MNIIGINTTLRFRPDPIRGLAQFWIGDAPPDYLNAALDILGATEIKMIASDASYRGLPQFLGDEFRAGQHRPGRSSAVVLVVDATFNPLAGIRQSTLALTITGLEELPRGCNTAKSESMANLIGLHLHQWTAGQPTIYTDCRALVTGTKPQDQLHRTTTKLGDIGGILHSIRRYREHATQQPGSPGDQYNWCRSHPENRHPQTLWVLEDWLILMADHYADSQTASRGFSCRAPLH